ncbi:MAG: L-2-hydroxyglutarate oxidase [Bryobacteraceae bacterium]|nr:L-2-hydroxyglutarate oxidase [Bryobacterales bacterium]MEB2360891.1 L-2-hydroxyglutarate oxidase [Bryobacterales bacterium]NUN00847.1 L-2-hydroxyglutarate oxidase [Bryobacteraceae bacterium]
MGIIVIGGGIVGLASALHISSRLPRARITVLEKEVRVGQHQTGHNSGVLHCGLYYKPGSIKARMAVTGIRRMVEFCQENAIPHEICGKLVVAASDAQIPALNDLFERGTANGLQGLRRIGRDELREIEPHVAGVAGIHVPQEGIADYAAVCDAMVHKLNMAGVRVITGARVERVRRLGSNWLLETPSGSFEASFVVNCAGLHSDRVSAMVSGRRELRIVPFRGEYYKIKPERQYLVRNLIYPVPDPRFPFLGVHFTRLIHGGIEAGPNAVLAFAREGYRKTDISIRDLADTFTYRGFWSFLSRYSGVSWQELRRSFSKERFCRSLQELVPEIGLDDLETGGAGVRAQAIEPDGSLVQDFRFVENSGALHVLNAPSPAATASLAIGEEIANRVAATK